MQALFAEALNARCISDAISLPNVTPGMAYSVIAGFSVVYIRGAGTDAFPPAFLPSGTRDLFLSSTERMHRALLRAGVSAQLHVWEGMPHGRFQGAPEDREVSAEICCFLDGIWRR